MDVIVTPSHHRRRPSTLIWRPDIEIECDRQTCSLPDHILYDPRDSEETPQPLSTLARLLHCAITHHMTTCFHGHPVYFLSDSPHSICIVCKTPPAAYYINTAHNVRR